MFKRIAGRLGWPVTVALAALVISVPALAIAERSATTGTSAAAKKKSKTLRGPRGPRGKRGPRGIQGFSGRAGKDGAAGPTGPVGAKGDTGATGDQKTKVFNVAMAVGDPDVTVLAYPPFTLTARCRDNANGTFTASLVAATSIDDSYQDASGVGADQTPDFDASSQPRVLGTVTVANASAAAAHAQGGFQMAAPPGQAVGGGLSIGTNVYQQPGTSGKGCLFTGATTTT